MRQTIFILSVTLLATAAVAHQGVKNPAVMARMDMMSEVGNAFGVLAGMASGKRGFDPERAAQARDDIAGSVPLVLRLFQAEERDPRDEARPEIWTNFPDFAQKAEAMGAGFAAMDVATLASLQASLPAAAATCGACHDVYRIKR